MTEASVIGTTSLNWTEVFVEEGRGCGVEWGVTRMALMGVCDTSIPVHTTCCLCLSYVHMQT